MADTPGPSVAPKTPSVEGRPRGGSSAAEVARKRGASVHKKGGADDMRRKLMEMGTYSKYLAGLESSPFEVTIRCVCGRSRLASWMFVCTYCATGGIKAPDTSKTPRKSLLPGGAATPTVGSGSASLVAGVQRPFLCCDMCSLKETSSYFCPHCLGVYFGHLRKYTRCDRCVECPICCSPLEKIAYTKQKKNADGTDSGQREDTYLYQCPFCYWSSDSVELTATDGDKLLETLDHKFEDPLKAAEKTVSDLAEGYKVTHREYEKEIKRGLGSQTQKAAAAGGFAIRSRASLLRAGAGRLQTSRGMGTSPAMLTTPKKKRKRRRKSKAKKPAAEVVKELDEQMDKKWNNTTLVGITRKLDPPTSLAGEEIKEDEPFLGQFQFKNFAPLDLMFEMPLTQPSDFTKHTPQKYKLMTKEAYKCPNPGCNAYVCKPSVGGRGVKFDVRTPVLEYLPRVSVTLMKGGLITSTRSTLLLRFENRLLQPAKMTLKIFDPANNSALLHRKSADSSSDSVSAEDAASLLDEEISMEENFVTVEDLIVPTQEFEIDSMDIAATGTPREFQDPKTGNYVKGKECGVYVHFKPKFYVPTDLRFSLLLEFESKIQWMSEDQRKGSLQSVRLDHVLDFNLGKSKSPEMLSKSGSHTPGSSLRGATGDPRLAAAGGSSSSSAAAAAAGLSSSSSTATTKLSSGMPGGGLIGSGTMSIMSTRVLPGMDASPSPGTGARGSVGASPSGAASSSSSSSSSVSAARASAIGSRSRADPSRKSSAAMLPDVPASLKFVAVSDGARLTEKEKALLDGGMGTTEILEKRKKGEIDGQEAFEDPLSGFVEIVEGEPLTSSELTFHKRGIKMEKILSYRKSRRITRMSGAHSRASSRTSSSSGSSRASGVYSARPSSGSTGVTPSASASAGSDAASEGLELTPAEKRLFERGMSKEKILRLRKNREKRQASGTSGGSVTGTAAARTSIVDMKAKLAHYRSESGKIKARREAAKRAAADSDASGTDDQ